MNVLEILDIDLKKELKKYISMDDLIGKNGLIQRLSGGIIQQFLEAEIDELYGIDISPSMISKITDKVMDTAAEWQNRSLDEIYPIVYMDAIHFKVREERRIVSKAAYICMALDVKGRKDILGIWIGEAEGLTYGQ